MNKRDIAWVVTTGEAGMRSQALGLAEAVGLPVVEKRVKLSPLWSWLPAGLPRISLAAYGDDSDPLAPPWPRLVIACGRRSIPAAIAIRRRAAGATFAVYIQDPKAAARHLDLVVPMRHDGLSGPNVLPVDTALHRVTPARLEAGRRDWRDRLRPHGAALTGILLGGPTRHHRTGADFAERLAALIRSVHAQSGGNVALTPSRRTPETVTEALRARFGHESWYFQWEGAEPNPLLGILALADRLVVTGESVSMISEALSTGNPVHVLPLAGRGRRHDAFLDNLRRQGLVSIVAGADLDVSHRSPGPVNATPEIARELRHRLGLSPPSR